MRILGRAGILPGARLLWGGVQHQGQRRVALPRLQVLNGAGFVNPSRAIGLTVVCRSFSGRGAEVGAHESLARWQRELEEAGEDFARLVDVRTRLEQAGDQGVGQAITLGSMAAGGVGGPKNPVLAEACFLPAAEAGDATAMFCLAQLYMGLGTEENDVVAREVDELVGAGKGATSAAAAGDAVDKAMALSIRKGIKQLVKQVRAAKQAGKPVVSLARKPTQPGGSMVGGIADTERWLRAAAGAGNTDAMVLLGNLLVTGQLFALRPARQTKVAAGGVTDVEPVQGGNALDKKRWEAEAMEWYLKAAEANQADACYNLALLAFEKEDEEGGRMWLDKASKLGDPDALYALGAENHAGGGHVEEGEKMLVRASQLGHADAAYYLSMIAREKGNLEEMSRQLEHSASLGGSEAHFCLGDMIFNGTDGYSVNYPKALRHFAAAARNRHAGALTSVGAMLYNGLGVKRDLGLAFRAYQLAAEAGSIAAMRNLASMHMLGEGCEKDMAKAKVLTKVADEAEAELERGGGLPTMQ